LETKKVTYDCNDYSNKAPQVELQRYQLKLLFLSVGETSVPIGYTLQRRVSWELVKYLHYTKHHPFTIIY